MRRLTAAVGAAVILALPVSAAAELRPFCPDRPGLDTPPCTIDRGHADVEVGLADWTLDGRQGDRTDTLNFLDTLVRYGMTDSLEAQLEWQGIGWIRDRSPAGSVSHSSGSGDLRIALRQNLHNPDGSGVSIALMPFVTLPVGSDEMGAGEWEGGLLLPLSFALPDNWQLAFTGEIDAAADSDGHGHHASYSGTVGLGLPLAQNVGATIELQQSRDDDPSGSTDLTLGGLAIGWQPSSSLQLDAGANVGLSKAAPDVELYAGVSRRF